MGRVSIRGIVAASISVVAIIMLFIVMFSNGWYFIDQKTSYRYYDDWEEEWYESEGETSYVFGLSENDTRYLQLRTIWEK